MAPGYRQQIITVSGDRTAAASAALADPDIDWATAAAGLKRPPALRAGLIAAADQRPTDRVGHR